jgi:hypothetical protein
MTGSRISNISLRCALACMTCALAVADDLTVLGGGRLTGTLRSINEAGVVELASALAPEPVLLEPGSVEKIDFSSSGPVVEPPTALVELVNGDRLPVSVEALDQNKLTVISPDAGSLEIPRAALKSLQLGISQFRQVYAGPRNLEEWTLNDSEDKNWTFENGGLIANGPATASLTLPLPQRFVLRFTLKWQAKQAPGFLIYFADPLKPKDEASDRYYLQFGSAGVEIKREASHGRRYNTIVQLNRSPNQYPDHQLRVEVRVDRKNSRLQLLLNGEPEGEALDPLPTVPDGSGIALTCSPSNGNSQEIRGIEVLELDNSRSRQLAEDRGNPQSDSLISREDDRWDGLLMDILKTGDGQVCRFKSGDKLELLEIPAADVATVFFAAHAAENPDAATHPFALHLRWGGTLQVTSCQFSNDAVAATHPLLGPLSLRRDGIVSLQRDHSTPQPAHQP